MSVVNHWDDYPAGENLVRLVVGQPVTRLDGATFQVTSVQIVSVGVDSSGLWVVVNCTCVWDADPVVDVELCLYANGDVTYAYDDTLFGCHSILWRPSSERTVAS